jgi:hypothetical protein
MKDKERFDACMEIAKYGSNNFHGRRNFEWKVTLGYWALLAAAVAFVKQNPTWIEQRPYLLWFAPISVLGFIVFWLRGIWVANANDKALGNHFLFEAEKIIHNPDHMPETHPAKITGCRLFIGFLKDWSAWFQIITTGFLALILYLAARL